LLSYIAMNIQRFLIPLNPVYLSPLLPHNSVKKLILLSSKINIDTICNKISKTSRELCSKTTLKGNSTKTHSVFSCSSNPTFETHESKKYPSSMKKYKKRHNWTKSEIFSIYNRPFHELMYDASTVHRIYWDPSLIQKCTLISIKTGGCTEDCSYCSQSVHNKTFVKPTPIMDISEVLKAARRAKDSGSTRFCMGSAWREMGNKKNAFKNILDMVKSVSNMGLEVCCTLGMITLKQAQQLKHAGLSAYNHNLDTSPEHYPNITSTRTYEDRLQTLTNVRHAGINVCCGGILGLGENHSDRVGLLHVLSTLPVHPESFPVNALVPVKGTPLGDSHDIDINNPTVNVFDMARIIATARIIMPRTMIRLSAGRSSFSHAEQYIMFQAGANSIFSGDTLLTTANVGKESDDDMFDKLGLLGMHAQKKY